MHGNVYEWCQNKYNPAVKVDQEDAETINDNDSRVLRGGSFNGLPHFVQCAYRDNLVAPTDKYLFNGFRVARTNLK
jgi:formylglycine-generating enzyme required for sulfatase activity